MRLAGDIEAIRRSLDLTPRDTELIRQAAPRFAGQLQGWVDAFLARARAEPSAAPFLEDPATVLRLRRSLIAWFEELISSPYDAAYERARSEIGRVHAGLAMPVHMMVTYVGVIRRQIRAWVWRAFPDDPFRTEGTADALDKALDLELALMLGSYRRHAREIERRRERGLYVRRAESRAERVRVDAADAATCYLALLQRAPGPADSERWATGLARALRAVVRAPARGGGDAAPFPGPSGPVGVAALVRQALGEVSLPPRTEVDVQVDPPDARVLVHEVTLRLALEELLQNALNRSPGGTVSLTATTLAGGDLRLEVLDGGPRWPESARSVEEAIAASGGLPIPLCEWVAELHGGSVELLRPPAGGGAIRLFLRGVGAGTRPA